ncbi:MAG: HDOD domain-containing protein [Eubacteriales bacterium]
MIYLKLLREISNENFTLDKMKDLIKKDLSLSYKLLKYINSAQLGFRGKIKSVNQAIPLLGKKQLKTWLYFVCINSINDKSEIIVVDSLIRARFAELIFNKIGLSSKSNDAYFMGMLSMIDLLLGRPMSEIINELYIPTEVKQALTGENNNIYAKILNFIKVYEKGEWSKAFMLVREINIEQEYLPDMYLKSLNWANDFM